MEAISSFSLSILSQGFSQTSLECDSSSNFLSALLPLSVIASDAEEALSSPPRLPGLPWLFPPLGRPISRRRDIWTPPRGSHARSHFMSLGAVLLDSGESLSSDPDQEPPCWLDPNAGLPLLRPQLTARHQDAQGLKELRRLHDPPPLILEHAYSNPTL